MDRWLLSILLASFLVQGFILNKVRHKACRADECLFLHCASSVIAGDGWYYYPEGHRTIAGGLRPWDAGHTPPLYVLFVSAHLILFGGESWPTWVTQILLVLAMAWLAYGVARAAWGCRAGLWAAALVGFYPTLIAFAHYNYSETVYTFLLLLALSRVLKAKRDGKEREIFTLATAGAAFGLATLTRDVTLYLTPLVALWAAVERPWDTRRAGMRFAALTVPVVFLVVPWTLFNAYRFDDFLLLSSNAGNVLYKNQNSTPPENPDWGAGKLRPKRYPEKPRRRCRIPDPVKNYRCEVANALQYMARHPERVVERAVPKLQGLVNPASFPIRFVRRGAYGPVETSTVKAVTLMTAVPFMMVTILAVTALWLGAPGPERGLTALVVVFFLVVFAVTFGMSRYRLPLMPLLAIQAASLLANPRSLALHLRSPLHWIGLLATVAFLVRAWVSYWPTIADVF